MKSGSVKIVDRVSAVEAIKRLNEEDLLFLNRLIVERLKLISQARATTLMTSFTKGDRVGFQAPDGRMLEGVVLRLNKKTISVVTDDDHQWNVAPGLLRLVRPKPLNAERLSELRKLFRPPGISAMDLLRAIRPRAGTYLGLPRNTVTPQPELGFFAKALEQGLEHSMTVKHNCRNRDSRKELTLLAAVLVPPGWLISLKKDLLLINPPVHED